MSVVRRRAIVRGMVQGVGFRMNTRAVAIRLGLSGFARNRADGSVEVEAQGDSGAVDELIAWLRVGPRYADVQSVEVSELGTTDAGGFDVF